MGNITYNCSKHYNIFHTIIKLVPSFLLANNFSISCISFHKILIRMQYISQISFNEKECRNIKIEFDIQV